MNGLARWMTTRRLRAAQRRDRRTLKRLMSQHAGLLIHPDAATAFASSTFHLEPGARVTIGANVVTERRMDGVRIAVRSGGELVIESGTWLRSEVSPVIIYVYEDARITIGPDSFLNGCQLSAKQHVRLGRECMIDPGARLWDSDQHPLDVDRPERSAAIEVGDHVWIASDVTILKGTRIGDESVIGTRSLVTGDIPPHTIAYGIPAKPRSIVGDRKNAGM
jgi:acetyltransferase-like isoleucine patch superfamily enzyme